MHEAYVHSSPQLVNRQPAYIHDLLKGIFAQVHYIGGTKEEDEWIPEHSHRLSWRIKVFL
jgi:hypothetical protein